MPPDLNAARVAALYRYPVKGLSAERLPAVALGIGETFPADRAFALENGPSGFDPAAPAWQPKIKFLCLMKNAKIAALSTRYDDASGKLIVAKDGRTLLEASLHDAAGRAAIERFFQDYMGGDARGPVRVLEAPRPQLLGRGAQSGLDHQSRERACARNVNRAQGSSAALSRQSLCGRLAGLGRRSGSWGAIWRSGARGSGS